MYWDKNNFNNKEYTNLLLKEKKMFFKALSKQEGKEFYQELMFDL